MANAYYNFDGGPFIPGTKVRSNDVNVEYNAIVSAFDLLPLDPSSTHRGTGSFAGITAGTGNDYTVAMPNTRTINQDGDEIVFIADRTSTGAATLNVDGIGAISIVKVDGSATAAGDFVMDLIYAVRYDETNLRFQMMMNTVDAAAEAAAAAASATASAASALEAYHWAQYPEDSLVPEGDLVTEYSAYHWSNKAAAWAASVNLPNITGNALKVLRANAGETGLEYWNILGTSNDWSLLQTVGGGIQVYGTIAGALHSGLGLEIETVTKPIIRGYDRSIPGYANILYDASQHEFYTSGTRTMAISTDYVTLGTAGAGTSPTIVLNSGVGGYPSFEWLEFGDRKAQMYHNSGSNEFLIRKYLDSNPATVVGQLVFADSGSIALRDEVNSKVLTAANGEFIANGGDYFAREARTNTFTQAQYFNAGGMCLALKPGAADHCYMSFYPDTASPSTRWAYLGFGGAASNIFFITTEQAGAGIAIQAAGTAGYITQQVNGVSMAYLDQYGLHNPNGMVRAQGTTNPTTGAGVEMVYAAGAGYLQAYDRGLAAWKPLYLRGGPTYISVSGTLTTTFASTYVHTNVPSFILEAVNPNVQLRDTGTTNMDWLMRVVSGNWYLSKANDGGGAVTRNHIVVSNAAAYDLGVGAVTSVYWLTYGNAVLGHWAPAAGYSGVMTAHNSSAYLMMTAGTHNHISTPNAAGVIYLRPGVNDGTNQAVVSASDLTYRGTSVRSFGTRMNSAGTKVAGYGTTSRISVGRFRVTHNIGGSGVIATANVEGAGTGSTIELQISYVSVNVFDVYARATSTGSLTDVSLTCTYVAI